MLAKQNITLSLDKQVIHYAKVLAAQKATSVSALLAQQLTDLYRQHQGYELAKQRALHDLEQGFSLGGESFKRDDLYER